MARAAAAVAAQATRMLRRMPPDTVVLLLVGPGNNGGDALQAGRLLSRCGFAVRACAVSSIVSTPPRAADAAAAWQGWHDDEMSLHPLADKSAWMLPRPPLVIDGLFGIGLTRALPPVVAPLITWIKRTRAPVLAIDVPERPRRRHRRRGGERPGASGDCHRHDDRRQAGPSHRARARVVRRGSGGLPGGRRGIRPATAGGKHAAGSRRQGGRDPARCGSDQAAAARARHQRAQGHVRRRAGDRRTARHGRRRPARGTRRIGRRRRQGLRSPATRAPPMRPTPAARKSCAP